jgi:hypothetical protein
MLHIFLFCDVKSLCKLVLVCKNWWYVAIDGNWWIFSIFTDEAQLWRNIISTPDPSNKRFYSSQLIAPGYQYKRLYFELGKKLFLKLNFSFQKKKRSGRYLLIVL